MSFPDAIKSVFSQYATFTGRARRSEFWFWYLFLAIIGVVASIVLGVVAATSVDPDTATMGAGFTVATSLFSLVYLAVLLPTLAVSVRRLHDQDKSGFFWFLGLIPFVGGIIMIVLYAQPGTMGPNRFGPDPKGVQAAPAPYGVPSAPPAV
ncbi:DUF805 domain-containing protein [Isoptericola sp. NPDC055881]